MPQCESKAVSVSITVLTQSMQRYNRSVQQLCREQVYIVACAIRAQNALVEA